MTLHLTVSRIKKKYRLCYTSVLSKILKQIEQGICMNVVDGIELNYFFSFYLKGENE